MYYELKGKETVKVQGGLIEMAERNIPMSKTLFKNTFDDVEVSTIFLAIDPGFGKTICEMVDKISIESSFPLNELGL